MLLVHGVIHLDLPEVHSLKGRRAVLNSLKDRLKRRNLSLLDLSGEYVCEADLAFACLVHDAREAARCRESIERLLERHFPELEWMLEYEEL